MMGIENALFFLWTQKKCVFFNFYLNKSVDFLH